MKMKISTKQIINFILISILTAAIGLMGIINMDNGNNNVKEIYEDRLIPIQNLSVLQNNLSHIQNIYSYILFDKSIDGFDKQMDSIDTFKDENSTLLEAFSDYNLTDDETIILNRLISNLEAYDSSSEVMKKYLEAENYDAALLVAPDINSKKTSVDETINDFMEENNLQAKILTESMQNSFDTTLTIMIIFVIIAILLSVVSNLIISRSINNPIKEILNSANLVADGNLDVHININTNDEMSELASAFNKITESTNTTVSKINSISNEVSTEARQVYTSSSSLSQGATEQASSIEQLKASIEEIASQTRHNADNAKMAKSITDRAKINAVNGNSHMNHMLTAMTKINESSNNISTIIKVIDEIAFQTNILALNAAIEAARAGEHGKGFAVVADEVRNLAGRSAAAAKETTSLIEESISKVEDGTNLANITSDALQKIVDDIEEAANLISNISIASSEQSIGVEQINQGVALIGDVVQTISTTSEENSALSESLSSQAEMLKEQVNKFKLKNNDTTSVNDTMEDLNPEVLEVLDNMESKNIEIAEDQTDSSDNYENSIYADDDKIMFNDTDFGKY